MIRLRDPCLKCIVKPVCIKHKECEIFQSLIWKRYLCKHNWIISPFWMRMPTGIMYECTKCGWIK